MKLIVYTVSQEDKILYINLDEAARDKRFEEVSVVAEGRPKLTKGEFILHVEEMQQKAFSMLRPIEIFSLLLPVTAKDIPFADQMSDLLGAAFGKRLKDKVYDAL